MCVCVCLCAGCARLRGTFRSNQHDERHFAHRICGVIYMYMYMYMYMYVYMHTYSYIPLGPPDLRRQTHTHTRARARARAHTHTHTRVFIYTIGPTGSAVRYLRVRALCCIGAYIARGLMDGRFSIPWLGLQKQSRAVLELGASVRLHDRACACACFCVCVLARAFAHITRTIWHAVSGGGTARVLPMRPAGREDCGAWV